MGVNGNNVYGYGDFQEEGCGVSFGVTGQVAADGTFVLSIPKPTGAGAEYRRFPSLTILGKVPAPGSTEWTGSFIIDFMGHAGCPNSTAAFVASQLLPLNGTYSGTIGLDVGGSAIVTPLNISVSMTEGIFTSRDEGALPVAPADRMYHYLPLTGRMTITGVTWLPSRDIAIDATADHSSRMQGDTFILSFRLEDGSRMLLTGEPTDSSERTFVASFRYFEKDGKIKVSGMGKLTRR
jgi:hypothetical protein